MVADFRMTTRRLAAMFKCLTESMIEQFVIAFRTLIHAQCRRLRGGENLTQDPRPVTLGAPFSVSPHAPDMDHSACHTRRLRHSEDVR